MELRLSKSGNANKFVCLLVLMTQSCEIGLTDDRHGSVQNTYTHVLTKTKKPHRKFLSLPHKYENNHYRDQKVAHINPSENMPIL
jgi:hypothetical protein